MSRHQNTSRAMRDMLLAARQHGLCCVALLAWLRHIGYAVAQIQDLTDADCRVIASRIKDRF